MPQAAPVTDSCRIEFLFAAPLHSSVIFSLPEWQLHLLKRAHARQLGNTQSLQHQLEKFPGQMHVFQLPLQYLTEWPSGIHIPSSFGSKPEKAWTIPGNAFLFPIKSRVQCENSWRSEIQQYRNYTVVLDRLLQTRSKNVLFIYQAISLKVSELFWKLIPDEI